MLFISARSIVLCIAVPLLFAMGAKHAFGQEFLVIDETFEVDPVDFAVNLEETGDAIAALFYTELDGSRVLTFQGNWMTEPETSQFELAFGVLNPIVAGGGDFVIDPADIGGIENIATSADVILNGRSGDTNFANEAVGFVLRLWQEQAGSISIYEVGRRLDSRDLGRFDVGDLRPEAFRLISGTGSLVPDFSAAGGPIAFGLALGNGWALPGQPATMIQTSARVDNWRVKVRQTGTLLADGFE